ncbi:hypothetical protein ACIE8Z_03480 (plasmid) [Cetobacterium somerae ATCC BAA-474]
MITNMINRYFPYILIYMCYYTNLPVKLEELTMIIFITWYILEKKFFELKLNLNIIGIISVVGSISLIQSYKNNYPVDRVLDQLLVIVVMFIGYDLLFKKYGYKKLFSIYLKVSYFICLLGILQFLVFIFLKIDILKYPIGSSYKALPMLKYGIPRIRSVAYEPGWLAQTLVPAVIYSLEVLKISRKLQKKYLVIIFVFFMTMSTGALISIPLYFILVKFKNRKEIMSSIFTVIILGWLTKDAWINKVIDTLSSLKKLQTGVFHDINASSFAILSNLYVALNNKNLFFGVGLGNHPYSYFRNFIDKKIGVYHFYGLNAMDAYSLLTRIISELGIVWTLLFIISLIMNINLKNNIKSIINIGAFLGIFSFLIRGGLYTKFGTTFILLLFYYTRKQRQRSREVQNNTLDSI